MGCVPPQPGFLEELRALTEEQGTVLIFDEVMTGFRVAYGGAQQLYKIDPDMTTLGKVIGGGLPVGAYGGKARLMDLVAPSGSVYQAGTLSGNPLAVAAGLKTLEILRRPGLYERLDSLTGKLTKGLAAEAGRLGVGLTVNRIGSMFTAFFTPDPVSDYKSAKKADTTAYGLFFHSLLEAGVYFPPSQFEAAFVSTSHSEGDVAATLQAASFGFSGLRP
jgi:glutamate-1-semialdehyde 2,1-aminomutase